MLLESLVLFIVKTETIQIGFSGFCFFNFSLNLSQVHYYSKLMTSIG